MLLFGFQATLASHPLLLAMYITFIHHCYLRESLYILLKMLQYLHVWVTVDGVWIRNWITEHLQILTTSNYSDTANSHTLKFTKARTKSSQSAVSSQAIAW
jgi:hypothetical protein